MLQSSAYWCEPGAGLADDSAPFAFDASPAVAAGTRRYAGLESAAARTPDIEFVSLRYGFFYGPGTWYGPTATWASKSANCGFRLSALAKACGAGCTSTMRPRRRQLRSNALPACTTSLTETPRLNVYGCPPLRARSARRRRLGSPKKRRSRDLVPIPSTMRPGSAAHRTRRPNGI